MDVPTPPPPLLRAEKRHRDIYGQTITSTLPGKRKGSECGLRARWQQVPTVYVPSQNTPTPRRLRIAARFLRLISRNGGHRKTDMQETTRRDVDYIAPPLTYMPKLPKQPSRVQWPRVHLSNPSRPNHVTYSTDNNARTHERTSSTSNERLKSDSW